MLSVIQNMSHYLQKQNYKYKYISSSLKKKLKMKIIIYDASTSFRIGFILKLFLFNFQSNF